MPDEPRPEHELVVDDTSDGDQVIAGIDPAISQAPMPHPGIA